VTGINRTSGRICSENAFFAIQYSNDFKKHPAHKLTKNVAACKMKITAPIFEAGLKCLTKCFLLSMGEHGQGNAYTDWLRTKSDSYRRAGIKRLVAQAVRSMGSPIKRPFVKRQTIRNGKFNKIFSFFIPHGYA
jgi:hypothetical protein